MNTMNEKKYRILEYNYIGESHKKLASGMTLEMAFAFIKGYRDTFYNEILNLIIEEEPRISDNGYQE